MTASVTPEQEELARDLATAFHGDEVEWRGFLSKAALILSNQSARLAATPSDPDAINEKRVQEDAKLASNVREAILKEIAESLQPFADFGRGENGEDIRDGLMRDRICDWFGPSDFDAIRALSTGEPKR